MLAGCGSETWVLLHIPTRAIQKGQECAPCLAHYSSLTSCSPEGGQTGCTPSWWHPFCTLYHIAGTCLPLFAVSPVLCHRTCPSLSCVLTFKIWVLLIQVWNSPQMRSPGEWWAGGSRLLPSSTATSDSEGGAHPYGPPAADIPSPSVYYTDEFARRFTFPVSHSAAGPGEGQEGGMLRWRRLAFTPRARLGPCPGWTGRAPSDSPTPAPRSPPTSTPTCPWTRSACFRLCSLHPNLGFVKGSPVYANARRLAQNGLYGTLPRRVAFSPSNPLPPSPAQTPSRTLDKFGVGTINRFSLSFDLTCPDRTGHLQIKGHRLPAAGGGPAAPSLPGRGPGESHRQTLRLHPTQDAAKQGRPPQAAPAPAAPRHALPQPPQVRCHLPLAVLIR